MNKHEQHIVNQEEDLQEVLESLRKGSADAFKFLYAKYNQKIYRFCLRILGDDSLAKDAFQETFIKVYENRMQFRGEKFSSWLFTIARHTCINYIRSQKNYDSYDDAMLIPTNEKPFDSGLKDQLEWALSQLSFQYREALILREYEDCTYHDIAAILNIDVSLAKVRVFRARVQLKKILEPIMKEYNES